MQQMRPTFRRDLRPLARRLTAGLFFEIWPAWAIGSLLAAGVVVLVCRLLVAPAAPYLNLLWLAPVLATGPALFVCWRRRYREPEVVAIADWLGGGRGLLLAVHERGDEVWRQSPMVADSVHAPLPRLRLQRLAAILPAVAFFVTALWLPQRVPLHASADLAESMASELEASVAELKAGQLITEDEERKLEDEIERLRKAAEERVDGSTWEAADALRERMAAAAAEKQDAAAWAEEALARYSSAATLPGGGEAGANANAKEFTDALQKLAAAGLLDDAPEELKALLRGGKLPTDKASLDKLQQSLGMCLGTKPGLGKGQRNAFGRFNPSEFPLDKDASESEPGVGGATRGRADADLTSGDPTKLYDRFKAQPLPPGAARSPDDWAPVAALPGTPQTAPEVSSAARARQYGATAGQAAWRRTLAPRHQSAVKKYFAR